MSFEDINTLLMFSPIEFLCWHLMNWLDGNYVLDLIVQPLLLMNLSCWKDHFSNIERVTETQT